MIESPPYINELEQAWPRAFGEPSAEYERLHQSAGYLDLTGFFGWLVVEGKDAASFLQGLLTAHVRSLSQGATTESWALDAQGKILFHITVHRRGPSSYLLQTAAIHRQALQTHLDKYLIMEEAVVRPEPDFVCVTLQGAQSALFQAQLQDPSRLFVDHDRCGLGGVDILLPPDQAPALREQLQALGLAPVGYDALTCVRLESFKAWFGVDMIVGENPITYGKGGSRMSYTKGCFLGQETVARSRDRGHPARLLVQLSGQEVAAQGESLLVADQPVGQLLSNAWSPGQGAVLGLGLVKFQHAVLEGTLLDGSGQSWRIIAVSNYNSD